MSRSGITRERLIGLFVLGLFLFSPAIVSLVDHNHLAPVFGVPFLYVYLFGVWIGLIALSAGLIIYRQFQITRMTSRVQKQGSP